MPAQHSGFIEVFLAAADLAPQVAFVGQAKVAEERRRDRIPSLRPEKGCLRMQVPEGGQALEKGTFPGRQIEREIDLITAAIGIRIRVVQCGKPDPPTGVSVQPATPGANCVM